jgi:hypothetical protein
VALTRRRPQVHSGTVSPPWVVGAVTALLLTGRNVVPTDWPSTVGAALAIAVWLVVTARWSARSGGDGRHVVATLVGDLLSIGGPAFLATPLGDVALATKLASNVLLLVPDLVLVLVLVLAGRGYRAEQRWSAAQGSVRP